ncbi:hypothetical protein CANARDRAFT_179339, partial [[Candida] arabinofermentans NRRL YB-2248]
SQIVLSIVRAFITLKIASLDGYLVSSLISRKFKKFSRYLVLWLLIGIPSSITNSLLTKTQGLLSRSIRMNLTNKIMDEYLPDSGNSTIYQMVNQAKEHGSNGEDPTGVIDDPNQRITTIVEQFSDSLSTLPSQLLKPSLDILLGVTQLSKSGENVAEGALLLGMITNVSTLVLKIFTPNFSRISSTNNELENKFHAYHSRIVNNNEEIALAKGHRREMDILDMNYFELERFKRMELRRMAVYDFAVSFIFKYSLGAFGLLLCSLPIFTTAYANNFKLSEEIISKISADFITNRGLLVSSSESLGKLVSSKKNIQNLFGYGDKLWEFEQVLMDINKNASESSSIEASINFDPLIKGPNVSYGDEVSFQNVPLVTPNGTTLVKNLSFSIKPGENLLIIGPNGCGKSSLFRVLGGLWEVQSPGHLVIPEKRKDLFYLPQRSYLTYGSLREQIIYPHSIDDLVMDDLYLIDLLRLLKLDHLLTQASRGNSFILDDNKTITASAGKEPVESPLDIVKKWPDLLSIGEQQRLAMVRLYYHQPKFAVLDECTSSISPDLEQECYRIATEDFGITVLSVCHRTSLWKFHTHVLKFNKRDEKDDKVDDDEDEGAATVLFTKFDPEKRLERHNELIEVETNLKKSSNLNKRLSILMKMKQRSQNKLMYINEDDD